jgi:hypothetical protein
LPKHIERAAEIRQAHGRLMATLLISRVAISANVSVAFIRNRDVGAFIGLDLRAPLHERLYIHAMGVKSIVRHFSHQISRTKWGVNFRQEHKHYEGRAATHNFVGEGGGTRGAQAPGGDFSGQVRVSRPPPIHPSERLFPPHNRA